MNSTQPGQFMEYFVQNAFLRYRAHLAMVVGRLMLREKQIGSK